MGENDIQSDNPFNSCYASFCKDRRRGDLGVTPLTLLPHPFDSRASSQVWCPSNCFEMIILSG